MSKATELKQKINESKDKKQSKLGQLNERLERAITDIKVRGGVILESLDVTKIKPKFAVYEDNGGGLHLVVWDKNKIYVFHGYEYAHGNLAEDLKTLLNKGFNINNWDNEEDGKSFLKEVENSQYGYELVADNEGIYWDDMGGNAKYEFKVLK